MFDVATAQAILNKPAVYDEIDVAAKPGVSQDQLAAKITPLLPANAQVKTAGQFGREASKEVGSAISIIRTFLLVFGAIALFVGAFVIFNTISITIAQRTRELATLRTLGASRRQIWRAVVSEGLLLGFVGGVAGFVLGIGTAALLRALFKAFGADLPSKGVVVETRTIIVTVVVGTVVSLVASVAPAMRAMRVPPVEALREGVVPMQRGRGRRLAIGAGLLLAIGVGLMCVGLFGSLKSDNAAISFMGGGAALTFLGVALLSPRLVRPLANVIGAPIERATGITGQLARENSVRQPGRTAVTAAALIIGVALVTFASIFAVMIQNHFFQHVDVGLETMQIVQVDQKFTFHRPIKVGDVLTGTMHVETVDERFGAGPPSLVECERLMVRGDVAFGADVVVLGAVEISHDGDRQCRIEDATVLEG